MIMNVAGNVFRFSRIKTSREFDSLKMITIQAAAICNSEDAVKQQT